MHKVPNNATNKKIERFNEYFKCHDPSFLVKDSHNANETRNVKIVNYAHNALIDIRNTINKKETPENENPDKAVNIVEKILAFNKKQNCKGLKILTCS